MPTKERVAPVSQKQPSGTRNTHLASIRKAAVNGGKIRGRGRPEGALPPRIARIECFIEALVALKDDEQVLERSARVLFHVRGQRIHNRKAFRDGTIAAHKYDTVAQACDSAEYRIFVLMQERARRLRERIIPEVKQLAHQAEKAA